jgi:glycosyltransferase involved in cell wall biosynthesis
MVSVGLPTYRRPETLARALRSVLAQTHRDLEVVVSDDASPEAETERVVRELAAADTRVRYIRQPQNLGHASNYAYVLGAARGEHFMWLADDDWIDPAYIARCLHELGSDDSLRLVAGLARYYRDGDHVIDERPTDLLAARPGARIVRYFARVNVNGPLFGVTRRADLLSIGFPGVVGGDWTIVAALAASGRVRTLRDVHIHRSMSGLGKDARALAESFGYTGLGARSHHVLVARRLAADLAWRDPAYDVMSRPERVLTAVVSATLVLVRFPGLGLLRRVLRAVGLDRLEDRAGAWVRARETRSAR